MTIKFLPHFYNTIYEKRYFFSINFNTKSADIETQSNTLFFVFNKPWKIASCSKNFISVLLIPFFKLLSLVNKCSRGRKWAQRSNEIAFLNSFIHSVSKFEKLSFFSIFKKSIFIYRDWSRIANLLWKYWIKIVSIAVIIMGVSKLIFSFVKISRKNILKNNEQNPVLCNYCFYTIYFFSKGIIMTQILLFFLSQNY